MLARCSDPMLPFGSYVVPISFLFGSYFVCTDVRPIKVCSYLVSTLFLLGLHTSWWSYASHPLPLARHFPPIPFPIAPRSLQVGFHLDPISFLLRLHRRWSHHLSFLLRFYSVPTWFAHLWLAVCISVLVSRNFPPFCIQLPQGPNLVSTWFPFGSYFVCTDFGPIKMCAYLVSTWFLLGLHTFGCPLVSHPHTHLRAPSLLARHQVAPTLFQFGSNFVPIWILFGSYIVPTYSILDSYSSPTGRSQVVYRLFATEVDWFLHTIYRTSTPLVLAPDQSKRQRIVLIKKRL